MSSPSVIPGLLPVAIVNTNIADTPAAANPNTVARGQLTGSLPSANSMPEVGFFDSILIGLKNFIGVAGSEKALKKAAENKEEAIRILDKFGIKDIKSFLDSGIDKCLDPKESALLTIAKSYAFATNNAPVSVSIVRKLQQLERKYLGADQLLLAKLDAFDKLGKIWPQDTKIKQVKQQLPNTPSGRAKVDELFHFFNRDGQWGVLNRALGNLDKLQIAVTEKEHLFGLFTSLTFTSLRENQIPGGDNVTGIGFLVEKDIISREDQSLLDKFRDNKEYMNAEERKRLEKFGNEVIRPINLVLDSNVYAQVSAIATPEEKRLLCEIHKKINKNPDEFSSSDVHALKKIQDKYFGKDIGGYKRKRETIDNYKKLFGYKDSDTELTKRLNDPQFHVWMENPHVQHGLSEKAAIYDRKGIWGEISKAIADLQQNGGVISKLFRNDKITAEEREWILNIEAQSGARDMTSEKRAGLKRLYKKTLLPLHRLLFEPRLDYVDLRFKQGILGANWFEKSELEALRNEAQSKKAQS